MNLLWLVPGVVGGSEEYTTRCLGGLAERPPAELDLTLFVLAPFVDAHPRLAGAFETVVLGLDGRRKPSRVAAESSWLVAHARRRRLDLLHHAGGVVPPLARVPSVLTIHDLQPLVEPANFSVAKRAYLRAMLPRSARAARLVVTPSDQAGRSVVEVLGVPADRVQTVPHGIEPLPADRQPDVTAAHRLRTAHHIDGPFFLYPAVTWPHKGHVVLLRAFAELRATHPTVQLVLTGGAAGAEAQVRSEVERLGVGDAVRRLGRVPRADLDVLIDEATAVTVPSRFEGFGAPALEAMARGCPVIVADATALPEVVGEAGLLVPPDRPHDWAVAMAAVLDEPDRRAAMARAGLARAATFGWDRSAAALVTAYRRALVAAPGRSP